MSRLVERPIHPESYAAGRETAERLIASPLDQERIPFALALVERHLACWPRPSKNGLNAYQYSRSRGFRDVLRAYLNKIGK